MKSYTHILAQKNRRSGIITFNRPSVHNALNIEMIREFQDAFDVLDSDEEVSVIMIQSNGKNFSAGADLEWMRSGLDQSEAELNAESTELALLFHTIHTSTKVVVSVVRGKALGGANGIIAASDIVLASDNAAFAFTEVKLGLLPATISPFVVRKVGHSVATEWMISGRQFTAEEAYNRGYVHRLVADDLLSQEAQNLLSELLKNAPGSLKGMKELIAFLEGKRDPNEIIRHTANLIAQFRVSEEGQEGIRSFFEKRQPNWRDEEK